MSGRKETLAWALRVIESRPADFVLKLPTGEVQFERWYVVPNNADLNVYIHRFSRNDPRVLHDHPSDHTCWLLSGNYVEYGSGGFAYRRREGEVVRRSAEDAHWIELFDYRSPVITLFTTGPRRRIWGFFTSLGWRPYTDFIDEKGNPKGDPLRIGINTV